MEVQSLEDCKRSSSMEDYHSNVDTSRPFRSVKEAVAIFGERFLVREIYSPAKFTFSKQETPYYSPSSFMAHSVSSDKTSIDSDDPEFSEALKKLEAELEETKMELKMLKERESETEVALASLNAEVHKNMAKLAMDEANAGGKPAMTTIKSKKYGETEEEGEVDEEKLRNLVKSTSSLAQILSIREEENSYVETKKIKGKKKPIIPLFGGLFSRKKGSSTTLNNPLFSYSPN